MAHGAESESATCGDRACPYCGAPAFRPVEETPGSGVLDETISVCFACGQSVVSPRWTAASTRRGLLRALAALGPAVVLAVAAWILKPWRALAPLRAPGAT